MDEKQVANLAAQLNDGKVGVVPTDTIYGIVGLATRPEVVERIYAIKGRPNQKPFVVLVSYTHQLSELGLATNIAQEMSLKSIWPGPVSVIIPCPSEEMNYLHRGLYSLAIRLPNLDWLRDLVSLTGPLVATSANTSGSSTPQTIDEIKTQLPGLDFYAAGEVGTTPSQLMRLQEDGELVWLSRS